jgi:hypothetical protein
MRYRKENEASKNITITHQKNLATTSIHNLVLEQHLHTFHFTINLVGIRINHGETGTWTK